MAYTLITSLGTGMYKKEGGYRRTDYKFPNINELQEDSIFFRTILKTKFRDIEKIIIVGTVSSSWDVLLDLDDKQPEEAKLWEEIVDTKNLQDAQAQKLEEILQQKYHIPVVIRFHTDKVDTETTAEVFSCYNSLVNEIDDNSNILFDITHGFRSMPILLFQTLQFSLISKNPNRKVDVVYGEYIDQEKISYVRDLSNYWTYSQITDAISVFQTKLDGFKLAELIKPEWESGAKVIKRISEIVQTNFALQIIEVLRQVKNSIDKFPEVSSPWLNKIKDFLKELLNLSAEKDSETLFNYSKFLFAHQLNTQAIITLQICVETAIAEKYGNEQYFGDYDWWQDYGRGFLKDIENENKFNKGKLRDQLNNLEGCRNQIAHGGAKNKYTKGYPSAANIPSIYESGKQGVETLLKILKEL